MTSEIQTGAERRRQVLDQITERIVGYVHQASKTLGSRFVEKVDEDALAVELARAARGLINGEGSRFLTGTHWSGFLSPNFWSRNASSLKSRQSSPSRTYTPRNIGLLNRVSKLVETLRTAPLADEERTEASLT